MGQGFERLFSPSDARKSEPIASGRKKPCLRAPGQPGRGTSPCPPAFFGEKTRNKMKNRSVWIFLSAIFLVFSIFSSARGLDSYAIFKKDAPKTVFLTFDDGPDKINTPKVLDILKEHNVKETFFVMGHKAEKNPSIIKRINDEGHTIGNHTYSHINSTIDDNGKIKEEIEKTHKIIYDACKTDVSLFRPPFGNYDWRAFKVSESLGYKIVLWTFDVCDWDVHDAKKYLKTVKENLSDGAIILLHDGGPKREALIEALPNIIEYIKSQGYKFENKF